MDVNLLLWLPKVTEYSFCNTNIFDTQNFCLCTNCHDTHRCGDFVCFFYLTIVCFPHFLNFQQEVFLNTVFELEIAFYLFLLLPILFTYVVHLTCDIQNVPNI